jgi:hypothetical protein
MSWNEAEKSLEGISITIPDHPYTLFIHVPEDFIYNEARIEAEHVSHKMDSRDLLEVSFTGKENPVQWKIAFREL